jgi:SAM-dependent methyltransferase
VSVTRYRSRLYEHYRSGLGLGAAASEADSTKYILRRLLRGYVPQDKAARILDLGCGSGMLIHLFWLAGYQNAVGVDISVEQVAAAKAAGIAGIEHGDLLEFLRKTATGTVAVVITWDIIEHLFKDETLDLAEQIARVLRPGGRWIIHVPNGDSPFFGRIRYGDWTHEQAFTSGSLDQLLSSVGFQEVTYQEDRPIVHGVISAFRRVLWHLFRSILRVYLAAETGDPGRHLIVSQNLMAVATKGAHAGG